MAWLPSLGPPVLDLAWFPAPLIEDDATLTAREDEYDARLLDVRTAPGAHARVNTPTQVDLADSDEEDSDDDDPY